MYIIVNCYIKVYLLLMMFKIGYKKKLYMINWKFVFDVVYLIKECWMFIKCSIWLWKSMILSEYMCL